MLYLDLFDKQVESEFLDQIHEHVHSHHSVELIISISCFKQELSYTL